MSGAAVFGAAAEDCFISLALAAGSTSFAAGSAHLHVGESVTIALPMRKIELSAPATINLLATSVETGATVSPSNSEGQGSATYITVLELG